VPYTRIIEHKFFENNDSNITWLTNECPEDFDFIKSEPYYPVNDQSNNEVYKKYKKLSEGLDNVYFGGRLAEYKYYNMDSVIESALKFVNKIK
jgi:UDP-galactopyranose mutase